MTDWRLERLKEIAALDRRMAPPACEPWWAEVYRSGLFGYIVSRPGVPDWQARESWHPTRRMAEKVKARWNATLAALGEEQKP